MNKSEEARRIVGKWLNEEAGDIPREEIAVLCAAFDTHRQFIGKCAAIMECNDPGNYRSLFGGNEHI